MKVFFDLTKPMFLSTEPSFDGYQVEVNSETIRFCNKVNAIALQVKLAWENGGAIEDEAQKLADVLQEGIRSVLHGEDQIKDTPDASPSEQTPSDEVGEPLWKEV